MMRKLNINCGNSILIVKCFPPPNKIYHRLPRGKLHTNNNFPSSDEFRNKFNWVLINNLSNKIRH